MKEIICIVCPNGCRMQVEEGSYAVSGNLCKRGEAFAKKELTNPSRSLTTTVRTTDSEMPMLPVRTDGELPKEKIREAMQVLNELLIDKPVVCGEVILENILGLNCNIIATCNLRQ